MSQFSKSGIGKRNILYLIIAVIMITIGYFIMAMGDILLSPIILVIAYIVLIPISLLIPTGNDKS